MKRGYAEAMLMSKLSFQRFSLTLIVTLFLCQVIGTFCPMVVPIASTAEASLQHLHPGHAHSVHTMIGEGMCPDSRVTPMETLDIPLADSLSVGVDMSVNVFLVSGVSNPVYAPHETPGLPLYMLLSTFRI